MSRLRETRSQAATLIPTMGLWSSTLHHAMARTMALCLLVAAISLPSVRAWAKPTSIQVTIGEHEGRSIVHIRTPEGSLGEPETRTSSTGVMLIFDEGTVSRGRLHANEGRLDYVSMQQTDNGAVVRLVQRSKNRGSFREHVEQKRVPGGFDVVVLDRNTIDVSDDSIGGATDASGPTTTQTLESLQASLSGPATTITPVADRSDKEGIDFSAPDDPATIPPTTVRTNERLPDPTIDGGHEPVLGPSFLNDSHDPPPANEKTSPPERRTSTPIQATWIAGPALALIALAVLWLRRRRSGPFRDKNMEVIERAALGPKQQAVRLRVGQRDLLLGVTEHQVALIFDLGHSDSASRRHSPVSERGSESSSSHGHDISPLAVVEAPNGGQNRNVSAFKNRLAAALAKESKSERVPGTTANKSPPEPGPLQSLESMLRAAEADTDSDPAWTHEDVG